MEILRNVWTEIQSIRGTLQAYDVNTSARLINNYNVRTYTSAIKLLINVCNGANIPYFPTTIDEIMVL